ncbi:MAG: lipid-A-disaccharide synthase [Chitinophagaceae bacterium]|nr:lipid-A-disaccharide synthase [Chitinophagaceae bacterium]MCB9056795.1 lipid-A-disaccharide synthase [Chitinophagales bacterium]
MKYYIIAGEASGDLHGSNLIVALKQIDPEAAFRCWGGDKMQQAGAVLVKHYRDLAFMGFAEVAKNLPTIFRNLKFCKKDILECSPDVIILIDYPGFNLRIAKWAHKQGQKIIYYISPQVWAWKENRVRMMKQCIDKMMVILPFEKEYYKSRWNWDVTYTGHPLANIIHHYKETISIEKLSDKPIVALLPGSRKQEILKKLPVMLEVSSKFPEYQFIVAVAPGLDKEFYNDLLSEYNNVTYASGITYQLLLQAKAALVTSGTATLETALFGVPQVVCYKGSYLSYQIGRRLVNVKYISLVNLILDKPAVKELIQNEFNAVNLEQELRSLLNNEEKRKEVQKDYTELQDLLLSDEDAPGIAASTIVNFLKQ